MPKDLHVGSIGFATSFGSSGGAVFPFIVGAIAQSRGVKSLPPVILALLTAISGMWLFLPRVGKKDDDMAQESQESQTCIFSLALSGRRLAVRLPAIN